MEGTEGVRLSNYSGLSNRPEPPVVVMIAQLPRRWLIQEVERCHGIGISSLIVVVFLIGIPPGNPNQVTHPKRFPPRSSATHKQQLFQTPRSSTITPSPTWVTSRRNRLLRAFLQYSSSLLADQISQFNGVCVSLS